MLKQASVGLGGSTHKKCMKFAEIAVLPRHSFRSPIRKLQVCKHFSNRMIIAQSAERLMRIFLGERRGIGLKFAANVHFGVQNYFFIKKIGNKDVCFCCCPMK